MTDLGRYPSGTRGPAPKVLYIGGTGRTGSTLVARLLGQFPGWFAAGEMAFLWRYGLEFGGRCSCGRPTGECDVWASALARARERVPIDGRRMARLRRRFWSVHLPLMVTERVRHRMLDRLVEYPATVDAVYRAIAEATGSHVIVDSSKEPHYSYILRERTDAEVYFLQLVRDPRAVGHSWQRHRRELGFADDSQMERRGPIKAAVYYDVSNLAAEALWRSQPDRYRLLRYEDFVDDPRGVVEGLARFVGEPVDVDGVLRGRTFDPDQEHLVWGNPNRFDHGPVTVTSDTRWQTNLASRDSMILTWLCGGLSRRYGYPWRRADERLRTNHPLALDRTTKVGP